MGNHGWAGRPPATNEEARQRIIDATVRCIDRQGVAGTTLSDVAQELGVTRQTVYRHVGTLNDIVAQVAAQGAESFVDQLVDHLAGVATPAEAVVEGFLFCLRTIPTDPRLSLLLELGDLGTFGREATSSATLAYGAQMLRRYPVNWSSVGISDDDLTGLAEVIMRLLISLLQNPNDRRPEPQIRALLDRWLVPSLQIWSFRQGQTSIQP